MFRNRFILVLGVLSALLVTMAVSRPFTKATVSNIAGANDFYQRHTNWGSNAAASDYYERHRELSMPAGAATVADINGDYYLRHLEWASNVQSLGVPVTSLLESPDYFQRHPKLIAPEGIAIDTVDYFLRHPELRPAAPTNLSDYFLRH